MMGCTNSIKKRKNGMNRLMTWCEKSNSAHLSQDLSVTWASVFLFCLRQNFSSCNYTNWYSESHYPDNHIIIKYIICTLICLCVYFYLVTISNSKTNNKMKGSHSSPQYAYPCFFINFQFNYFIIIISSLFNAYIMFLWFKNIREHLWFPVLNYWVVNL